jgi:hypothetical protein
MYGNNDVTSEQHRNGRTPEQQEVLRRSVWATLGVSRVGDTRTLLPLRGPELQHLLGLFSARPSVCQKRQREAPNYEDTRAIDSALA